MMLSTRQDTIVKHMTRKTCPIKGSICFTAGLRCLCRRYVPFHTCSSSFARTEPLHKKHGSIHHMPRSHQYMPSSRRIPEVNSPSRHPPALTTVQAMILPQEKRSARNRLLSKKRSRCKRCQNRSSTDIVHAAFS